MSGLVKLNNFVSDVAAATCKIILNKIVSSMASEWISECMADGIVALHCWITHAFNQEASQLKYEVGECIVCNHNKYSKPLQREW